MFTIRDTFELKKDSFVAIVFVFKQLTYIHTYIHTYIYFISMLEIYRVAVELMYSRK